MLGTQTIATLIAVYGLFMAPLGWKWAGFVWAYALVWALINDRVKLLAYRILDPSKPPAGKEDACGPHASRSRCEPMNSTSSESGAKVSSIRTGWKRKEKYGVFRQWTRLRKRVRDAEGRR